MKITVVGLVAACLLASCGGSEGEVKKTEEKKVMMLGNESVGETRPSDLPETAELVIEANDQMQYNTKMLEVWNGQKVKLTLTHTGTLPIESMGHNWVLLKDGVNMAEFAEASIAAKDNGYIAPERAGDVIAFTEQIGGGGSTTIEFDAPAKGSYTFLCTFPGHFGMMNGKLVVK